MSAQSIGRIPLIDVRPALDIDGTVPKAFVGEVVPVSVTSFREGHDIIGVALHLHSPKGTHSRIHLDSAGSGTDRWHTLIQPDSAGIWKFTLEAFTDDYATWLHAAHIKVPAGLDVEVMLALGSSLLEKGATDKTRSAGAKKKFLHTAKTLVDTNKDPLERLATADDPEIASLLENHPLTSLNTVTEEYTLLVERLRAGVGNWYEFFPRSEGAVQNKDGSWQSGTFTTASQRLDAVADMGFNVLYLPPIHPIGEINRKGPNNTLVVGPNDPGSPWAIGSAAGGHDAVHPDLGTVADFTKFLERAKKLGIEIALDLALQAAPDHPWVKTHPEFFTTLPDGSIAFAENPPKKYQDIYPLNFDNDYEGIRKEMLRVVTFWIGTGVRIFRVDNPHTKPVHFWQWLISEVNREYPDVIFLAEAFTRPAMMHTLAKVGFQQSYSYFTWRNTKWELEEFLNSIAHDSADFFRPNLFVNTPDILTEYLQFGGPAAFTIRATVAAMAAPSWGVYAGFELYESVARPGAEEYIDNEKYEYKPRDWAAADKSGHTLAPYLTLLNKIRAEHPALGQLRNLTIQRTDDEAILCFSKHLEARYIPGASSDDTIIVVVNTDSHTIRETVVHLDFAALGVKDATTLSVTNMVTNEKWTWHADNYVRLDPHVNPVHILHVTGAK